VCITVSDGLGVINIWAHLAVGFKATLLQSPSGEGRVAELQLVDDDAAADAAIPLVGQCSDKVRPFNA